MKKLIVLLQLAIITLALFPKMLSESEILSVKAIAIICVLCGVTIGIAFKSSNYDK